jgi:putative IMPACT (imprinted ancient) family translation regulator
MNDDGEPSGTAGKPIYGQLLTYDLTDILAVVVRYFGGTLLGTAGLINAYRQATANMLTHANVIEKFMEVSFRIGFPYDGLNKVMQVLKEEGIIPVHPEYNLRCSMDIRVRKSLSERISARLSVISGMTLESVSGSD